MLSGITMGQYLPGRSPVHRMDPRAKLLAAALVVPAILLAGFWPAITAVTLWLAVVSGLSGLRPGVYWRSMKPLWVLLLLSFTMQAFFTPGEPLVHLGWINISEPGLVQGALLLWRLGILLVVASVITFTTTPLQLTNGLEWLLSPLIRLRVPVRELAMIMNLALRFVPTLFDEARLLLMAQQSRGADFTHGSIRERVRGLVPFMVPLLTNIFRRADDLALAMELRCYQVGAPRSRLTELRFVAGDYAAIAATAMLLVFVWGTRLMW
ncbi:MAG: hypothetical protein VR67_00250 [Peptococcaceae bacterium BRH_c8a]|nr:MAG: hypothetical protein VR67_00250 [Peptococcaceae bacterium BRH_c8a]